VVRLNARASSRGVLVMEPPFVGRYRASPTSAMRRPRAGTNVPPHPGGAGAPPGTTMSPCEELADGGRLGRPGRLQGAVTQKGSPPEEPSGTPRARAESAARRRKENAARGAPRGAVHRQRCTHVRNGRAAWRASPSRLPRGKKGKAAYPGPLKNTGDDVWLFDNRSGGGANDGAECLLLPRTIDELGRDGQPATPLTDDPGCNLL
jgi:hypothetical protein